MAQFDVVESIVWTQVGSIHGIISSQYLELNRRTDHATQLLNKLALNKCHFLFLEGEKILKQRRMKRKLECDSYISKSGSYMKMHVLMYTFAEVNSEVVLIYK